MTSYKTQTSKAPAGASKSRRAGATGNSGADGAARPNMAAASTSCRKRARRPIGGAQGGGETGEAAADGVVTNAMWLQTMTAVLINEARDMAQPVKVGRTREGWLLLAIPALGLDASGRVIVREGGSDAQG